MLHLEDSLVIGKGAHRVCYRHPLDQNKCIKIAKDADDATQALESKYYEKLLAAHIDWKHLSQYYGVVETNLGNGYVYQLIKDFDGTISTSLAEYLGGNVDKNISSDAMLGSLRELKHYLLDNKIIVRNLRPYNVMFQRISQTKGIAVIIDNIGHHNNFYHLSDRIAFLARKDIQKKWRKFETSLV